LEIDIGSKVAFGLCYLIISMEEKQMRALSMDLRERILAAVQDGKENMKQIAVRFAVSYKVVQKLKFITIA